MLIALTTSHLDSNIILTVKRFINISTKFHNSPQDERITEKKQSVAALIEHNWARLDGALGDV